MDKWDVASSPCFPRRETDNFAAQYFLQNRFFWRGKHSFRSNPVHSEVLQVLKVGERAATCRQLHYQEDAESANTANLPKNPPANAKICRPSRRKSQGRQAHGYCKVTFHSFQRDANNLLNTSQVIWASRKDNSSCEQDAAQKSSKSARPQDVPENDTIKSEPCRITCSDYIQCKYCIRRQWSCDLEN